MIDYSFLFGMLVNLIMTDYSFFPSLSKKTSMIDDSFFCFDPPNLSMTDDSITVTTSKILNFTKKVDRYQLFLNLFYEFLA